MEGHHYKDSKNSLQSMRSSSVRTFSNDGIIRIETTRILVKIIRKFTGGSLQPT